MQQLNDAQLLGLARRLRLLPIEAADAHVDADASGSDAKVASAGAKRSRNEMLEETETALSLHKIHRQSDRTFVLDLLLDVHRKRRSQADLINKLPLYPDENVLWDPYTVPASNAAGDDVLALPKLTLQFLTFYDYLIRSFYLYRLESAYEIRADLVDAIKRMGPRQVRCFGVCGIRMRVWVYVYLRVCVCVLCRLLATIGWVFPPL